jgi:hypothetical protein
MKFQESKVHNEYDFPPVRDVFGYGHADPELDPHFKMSYWHSEITLRQRHGDGKSILDEYPWLLEDTRFQEMMCLYADTIVTEDYNAMLVYRAMLMMIEMDRFQVDGALELEVLAIQRMLENDRRLLEVLCEKLLGEIDDDNAYFHLARGFVGKHFTSSGAIYGQIFERHPNEVTEFLSLFAKYHHLFALKSPSGVEMASRDLNYGPGFDVAVSARWLTEADKSIILAMYRVALDDRETRTWTDELNSDVLQRLFTKSGLLGQVDPPRE